MLGHGRAHYLIPNLGAVLILLLVLTGQIGAVGTASVPGQTATTTTISYQGRLTNRGGIAINASTPMVFRLYGAPTGGTALWTETRSGSNAVPVTNGVFSVLLGSLTPMSIDLLSRDLWLGIAINVDPEMTPREKLGTVPYASRAGSVVDGSITSAKLVSNAVGTAKLADGSVTMAKIADQSVTSAKLNIDTNIDVRGYALHNTRYVNGPENGSDFDILTGQNHNLWIKPRATGGVIHFSGTNTPIDMHGNVIANAGNLLTDPNASSIRYGSAVLTTDGDCKASIAYDRPFSESPYSIVATNGDFNASSFAVEISEWSKSEFKARIRKLDSTGCANSLIRINYIAVGR